MKAAVIGTPFAGKTTLFRLLTEPAAPGQDLFSGVGQMVLPVPGVEALARVVGSRQATHPRADLYDFDGFGKLWSEERAGRIFNSLAGFDLLIQVVNAFTQNPLQDFEDLDLRLVLTDLESAERHLKRLRKEIQAGKADRALGDLLERAVSLLETGKPLRALNLPETELKRLRGYGFLTLLPRVVVINRGEEPVDADLPEVLRQKGLPFLETSLALETEILSLEDPEEQRQLRELYGLPQALPQALAELWMSALDLMAFFTANEQEARAWLIRRGATALEAAAEIHQDLARGFIRAEVIPLEKFLEAGSWAAARERGWVRTVGRDHPLEPRSLVLVKFQPPR